MFKDTITYTDYNGDTCTETLYFNLSKPEIIKMSYSVPGGLEKKLQRILDRIENKDEDAVADMFDFFDFMMTKSYGVKSEDGKRFIKNEDVLNEFMQSEAYSVIFEKFMTDINYASKFLMAIMPSDVAEQVAQEDSYKEAMAALESNNEIIKTEVVS